MRVYIVFLIVLTFISDSTKAQDSEKLNFQITVKDYSKNILDNREFAARIRIVNPSSKVLYEEKQIIKTNQRGLATIKIGQGKDIMGDLKNILKNNTSENLYVKTELDPNLGTNYTIVNHTRINIVPFASYANTTSFADEQDTSFINSTAFGISKEQLENWNRAVQIKHVPGDFVAGGVVFFVDSTGENGLVATKYDIANEVPWMELNAKLSNCDKFSDGLTNTRSIVEQLTSGNYAAYHCDTLKLNGKSDWYLPSIDELNLLFESRYEVNKALFSAEDNSSEILDSDIYWSSTEKDQNKAYLTMLGNVTVTDKSTNANVRAIKRFSGLYDIQNYSWLPLLGPEEESKSNGKVSEIIENQNGDVLIDEDGKRGTICRAIPEIRLPVKITFKLQTIYDPNASEEPTILRGTGDFRLCFGGPPTGVKLDEINESNMGEFEGVQFRIHPHLDKSPIRVYTGSEPHTCTSIWLRYVDPDKLVDNNGLPITGLASDECQGRGSQCGWERVGLFEDGFGLKNGEEALVTVIISDPEISISTNDRKWEVDVDDLLAEENDIVGDVLRFDRITYMSVSHTNTSRGYETIRINDLKITPLE